MATVVEARGNAAQRDNFIIYSTLGAFLISGLVCCYLTISDYLSAYNRLYVIRFFSLSCLLSHASFTLPNSALAAYRIRSPKNDRLVHICRHPPWLRRSGHCQFSEYSRISTSHPSFMAGRFRKYSTRDTRVTFSHEIEVHHVRALYAQILDKMRWPVGESALLSFLLFL